MAIVGVGIDVVDISRFEDALRRTPGMVERLFTPAEADRPLASLAARFAAKEALAKALGAPGNLDWHDAEVVVGVLGPTAVLADRHRRRPRRRAGCRHGPPVPLPRRRHRLGRGGAGVDEVAPTRVEQVRAAEAALMAQAARGRADAAGRGRAGRRGPRPARAAPTGAGCCCWSGPATTAATRCTPARCWPGGARRSRRCCRRGPRARGRARGAAGRRRARVVDARPSAPTPTSSSTGSSASADAAGCATRRGARRCAPSPASRWSRSTPRAASTSTPASSTGPHVTADLTVTFGTHKVGHLVDPAASACGVVHLVDLGLDLPEAAVDGAAGATTSRRCCRGRDADAHKYTRGVVGVRAGSEHYPGAGVLSTSGAACGLAGMVRYVGGRTPTRSVAPHPEVVVGEGRVQAWVVGSGGGEDAAEALAGGAGATAYRWWSTPTRSQHLDGPLDGPGAADAARRRAGPRCSASSAREVEADQLAHVRRAAGGVRRGGAAQGPPHAGRRARTGGSGSPRPARRGWPPPARATCSAGSCGALLAAGLAPYDAGLGRLLAARRGRDVRLREGGPIVPGAASPAAVPRSSAARARRRLTCVGSGAPGDGRMDAMSAGGPSPRSWSTWPRSGATSAHPPRPGRAGPGRRDGRGQGRRLRPRHGRVRPSRPRGRCAVARRRHDRRGDPAPRGRRHRAAAVLADRPGRRLGGRDRRATSTSRRTPWPSSTEIARPSAAARPCAGAGAAQGRHRPLPRRRDARTHWPDAAWRPPAPARPTASGGSPASGRTSPAATSPTHPANDAQERELPRRAGRRRARPGSRPRCATWPTPPAALLRPSSRFDLVRCGHRVVRPRPGARRSPPTSAWCRR